LQIVKSSNGSLPDTDKTVGVVNNVLHSAFESCRQRFEIAYLVESWQY
jgi:hypothetical protein